MLICYDTTIVICVCYKYDAELAVSRLVDNVAMNKVSYQYQTVLRFGAVSGGGKRERQETAAGGAPGALELKLFDICTALDCYYKP